MTKRLTHGEYLVRKDFNPSGNEAVDEVKTAAAALIDAINRIPDGENQPTERNRGKAVAITKAQEASMWAVSAITAKPR